MGEVGNGEQGWGDGCWEGIGDKERRYRGGWWEVLKSSLLHFLGVFVYLPIRLRRPCLYSVSSLFGRIGLLSDPRGFTERIVFVHFSHSSYSLWGWFALRSR